MLKPTAVCTFKEYADEIFFKFLRHQLQDVNRIDVVWDQYWDESIKGVTRTQRGTGVRRRVAENAKIPSQWFQFLRDNLNKEELFSFLTSQLSIQKFDQEIHMTLKQSVKSSPQMNVGFSECNHEEADTRMVCAQCC